MTANVGNNNIYLRTSRHFPQEPQQLAVELNKMYLDVANIVNTRTVGTFATQATNTGEAWYLSGEAQGNKMQALRQVYTFTAAGNIAHGLTLSQISRFTRIYGVFTDGTNWYPLPYVDSAAATSQILVKVTGTNIVITAGAGAPAITKGNIVLEWV
jgi:hypothetical protein